MFLSFFDVISKFFRSFFDVYFLCFVFLYCLFYIFAFLCFVVLCFVIDPNNCVPWLSIMCLPLYISNNCFKGHLFKTAGWILTK